MHEESTSQPDNIELWGSWLQGNLRVDGLGEPQVDQRQLDDDGQEALDHQLGMLIMVIVIVNHEVGITVDVCLEVELHYLFTWVDLFLLLARASHLDKRLLIIILVLMDMLFDLPYLLVSFLENILRSLGVISTVAIELHPDIDMGEVKQENIHDHHMLEVFAYFVSMAQEF